MHPQLVDAPGLPQALLQVREVGQRPPVERPVVRLHRGLEAVGVGEGRRTRAVDDERPPPGSERVLRRFPGHQPAEAEAEQADPIRGEAGLRLQERDPAPQIGQAVRRGAGSRLERGTLRRRDGRRAAGPRQRVREQGGVPVLGEPASHAAQELGRAVLAGADDDPGARRPAAARARYPLIGAPSPQNASTIGRPSPAPRPRAQVVRCPSPRTA